MKPVFNLSYNYLYDSSIVCRAECGSSILELCFLELQRFTGAGNSRSVFNGRTGCHLLLADDEGQALSEG